MSESAVFSPTPATPGMLSDASPIRLFTSMSARGSTPYCSRTAASSMIFVTLRPACVEASSTRTCGETSCRLSRSPVAMAHSSPRSSHAFESVPRMSSASYPSHVTSL